MRDTVTLTGGLVLRPWHASDAPAVKDAFADPLMRGQSAEPVGTLAAAAAWIAGRGAEWDAGTAYSFAVAEAAGPGGRGTVLGHVSVGAVNTRHALGWVSYWTVPAARGRGIASRACRAAARWAFDEAGLFRLELGHRVNNPASCAVARAAGFAVEGRQRQKLCYDGVRYDVELHARLATDPEPAA
ncbi:GNAT family N-acetyltransferase [Streptomyces sp. 7-21]|uniref:GNAT family N-acetyltransferase n=1 Tax=Streptomyces sp. 7-21 TaxID=2802283 RepID=UPI00191CDA15|nr:GNAT family protein [Streptomyces sp. 7-21]MBL1067389.1 GNAT family N-acetyltransferase [Streptomyces sp. 7-21]